MFREEMHELSFEKDRLKVHHLQFEQTRKDNFGFFETFFLFGSYYMAEVNYE